MTEKVWTTRTGSKYHTSPTCQGLLNMAIQNKAAGKPLPKPFEIDLDAIGDKVPCLVCRPAAPTARTSPVSSAWDALARRVQLEFEREFVRGVLSQIRTLTPDQVEPQHQVSVGVNSYVLDFALFVDGRKFAIEIDGYEKVKGEIATGSQAQGKRNSRDGDLRLDNWEVIHFSNEEVSNEANKCAIRLASLLAAQGSRGGQLVVTNPELSLAEPSRTLSTQPLSTPIPVYVRSPQEEKKRERQIGWVLALLLAFGFAMGGIVVYFNGSSSTSETGSGTTEWGPGSDVRTAPDCLDPKYPIKGNVNKKDGVEIARIYHTVTSSSYARTNAEVCWADESSAVVAGFRPSKS